MDAIITSVAQPQQQQQQQQSQQLPQQQQQQQQQQTLSSIASIGCCSLTQSQSSAPILTSASTSGSSVTTCSSSPQVVIVPTGIQRLAAVAAVISPNSVDSNQLNIQLQPTNQARTITSQVQSSNAPVSVTSSSIPVVPVSSAAGPLVLLVGGQQNQHQTPQLQQSIASVHQQNNFHSHHRLSVAGPPTHSPAQVIVAPNTSTSVSGPEMISQPVLVQMPAQQYVPLQAASAPGSDTTILHHSHHALTSTQLVSHHQQQQQRQTRSGASSGHEDDGSGLSPPQQQQQQHGQQSTQTAAIYEDYNHYPNGSNTNTAGLTYYAQGPYVSNADYPHSYGGNVAETHTYLLLENGAPATQVDPGTGNEMQIINSRIIGPGQSVSSVNANQPVGSSRNDSENVMANEDEYATKYQTNRISVQPQTITWLTENYECAEGVSLPRSTLYTHYQAHCEQNNLEPVNAASFGKLIRSVFVGLRTRRLGTRGNSKYHYYGIRIKAHSRLNGSAMENSTTMPPVKRLKTGQNGSLKPGQIVQTLPNGQQIIQQQIQFQQPQQQSTLHSQHSQIADINPNGNTVQSQTTVGSGAGAQQNQLLAPVAITKEDMAQYLGNSINLMNDVWKENNDEDTDVDDPQKRRIEFASMYRAHYDQIIKALAGLNFHEIEFIWKDFWQKNNKEQDFGVETLRELVPWITQTDYTMYNVIINNLLLPNILKPIPQNLTQQIRNFAKYINKWMADALEGYDEKFVQQKCAAVNALSHLLRRYTSLNHLSTAANSVFSNEQQVQQMIADLNKVDFRNVQEQALWLCPCDDEMVRKVEQSFKDFLKTPSPHEEWSGWCQNVLSICLRDDTRDTAEKFLFRWNFYCSLVVRDLTLRSAQSFGSFHLIRLLFDEYLFYQIEIRSAKAADSFPLKILGEKRISGLNSQSNHLECKSEVKVE